MPRKKSSKQPAVKEITNGVIAGAGDIVEQRIASTIEENFMP